MVCKYMYNKYCYTCILDWSGFLLGKWNLYVIARAVSFGPYSIFKGSKHQSKVQLLLL